MQIEEQVQAEEQMQAGEPVQVEEQMQVEGQDVEDQHENENVIPNDIQNNEESDGTKSSQQSMYYNYVIELSQCKTFINSLDMYIIVTVTK